MHGVFAGVPVKALAGQRRDRLLLPPAAGKDFNLLLPSGEWYRVVIASFKLVCSAQVATRKPGLQLLDGDGNIRWQCLSTLGPTAGQTVRVFASEGQSTQGFSANEWGGIPSPEFLIPAGWSIGSITSGIQTEDQLSECRLLLEELDDTYPSTAPGVLHRPHIELDLEVAPHA